MDSGGASRSDESRHPEWDLMYRKGLTVKRIAELCHAAPQTVSQHIRVQRAKYVEMDAEHLANRPPVRPNPPSARWQANIDALAAFRKARGRYPTTGDPELVNRRLAHWLSRQRCSERAGLLAEDRRYLLTVLPGWLGNQRAEQEAARWLFRVEQLRAFHAETRRWPHFRDPSDEHERELGVWLHAQRQRFGRGQLLESENRLLDSLVPGWNAWRVKRLAAMDAVRA
jgi:hypothetical protein